MRFTTSYHQVDRSSSLDDFTFSQTEVKLVMFLGKIVSCDWIFSKEGDGFSTKLHIHSSLINEVFESKGHDFYYGVDHCLNKAKKLLKKSTGKKLSSRDHRDKRAA